LVVVTRLEPGNCLRKKIGVWKSGLELAKPGVGA